MLSIISTLQAPLCLFFFFLPVLPGSHDVVFCHRLVPNTAPLDGRTGGPFQPARGCTCCPGSACVLPVPGVLFQPHRPRRCSLAGGSQGEAHGRVGPRRARLLVDACFEGPFRGVRNALRPPGRRVVLAADGGPSLQTLPGGPRHGALQCKTRLARAARFGSPALLRSGPF